MSKRERKLLVLLEAVVSAWELARVLHDDAVDGIREYLLTVPPAVREARRVIKRYKAKEV